MQLSGDGFFNIQDVIDGYHEQIEYLVAELNTKAILLDSYKKENRLFSDKLKQRESIIEHLKAAHSLTST